MPQRPRPNLKLLSPAKVNLFLRVLRKREDGFHELHTLFERVGLCDEIILKKASSGIRVRSNLRSLPTGPKNIAYQAAQLLKDTYSVREGVSIRIHKRIPVRAGLGGGSSNAATVLLGLNRLWKLGLSKKELCALGAKLGSDVPFFVMEESFAEARGRGEILKAVRMPGLKLWHVIVKPTLGISTKEAYKALKLPRFTSREAGLTLSSADVKMHLRSLENGVSGRLSKLLFNSLEVTENKQLISIHKLKKQLLEAGALASLMSGSGSAVFGLFQSHRAALEAMKVLKKNRSYQVFTAATF